MSKTSPNAGLSAEQVIESRRKNGANTLTPPPRKPLWKEFAEKFNDPLILILLAAGLLSVGISCYEFFGLDEGISVFFEPVGIFMAILLATGLSFLFEHKAEKEFDVLNRVNDDEPVQVVRDGNMTQVPRRDIVVGDTVFLNTGEEVPADGRLTEAVGLSVDESSLTGEPICEKTTDCKLSDPDATFPSDHVMRGTKIMAGHGVMTVTAVGDNTENGRVFKAVTIDDSVKTPLDEQLSRLGRAVSVFSYAIGALIIAGRVAMYLINADFDTTAFITYLLQTIMLAVTVVCCSIPEGLPMAVTLSLAYSMRRMLKTNNLVRRLHACETMGATTVICTDKTGTLTQNRMQVADTLFPGASTDRPDDTVAEGIAVNSTARLDLTDPDRPEVLGNPTEGALILYLRSLGKDYATIRDSVEVVDELPFSTERKFMATVVRHGNGSEMLYVKGAPEIVCAMCRHFRGGIDRAEIDRKLSEYQNGAMRTLAFASQPVENGEKVIDGDRLTAADLTFDGIVAIADPVREDVPQAVADVRNAGIKIKIVTGDTTGTAKEIGRRIGLWDDTADHDDAIMTGPEFADIPDSRLPSAVARLKIISRARPMDKKRLVEALRANGEVVAVTGDGTNDAPALKAAHVGLSMGDGTSVAKEASDITIIDNSFTSIGRAVMWGRSLYLNIRRFILFQMTVNVAACLIVLFGSFMGMQSPLTVTQMLWVNLIMDTFAAMALAALPPSPSVMNARPRDRRDFIISRPMWRDISGVGLTFFILLMGLLYIFHHADITSLTDLLSFRPGPADGLSPYELSLFFSIFVFLQFWNMFNARAFGSKSSGLALKGCGEFEFIALVILVGQILIVTVGGNFFNVIPIKTSDWTIIIASTSLVLWIGEIARRLGRSRRAAA